MFEQVRYGDGAALFLSTRPHAEEARLVVRGLERGVVPRHMIADVDGQGTSLVYLPDGGHVMWWRVTGARDEVHVIESIE